IPAEVDTGGQQQLVVGKGITTLERYRLLVCIDTRCKGMNDAHTHGAQFVEVVTLLLECAQAAEIQIGEGAGVVRLGRFNQRDIDRGVTTFDVFGGGGTAETATNHHHFPGTARKSGCCQQHRTGGTGLTYCRQPLATGEFHGLAHCLATSCAAGVLEICEKCLASALSCSSE